MADRTQDATRRQFIVGGLAGLAATGMAPAGLIADDRSPAAGATVPTRRLGATGIELPLVSMGVMNADNPNLVAAALDGGIRMLDTAHRYQGGRNEEMIGRVLTGRPRDAVVLATKAKAEGWDRPGSGDRRTAPKESVQSFIDKVETSLRRLRTDHVDILHLHGASSHEDVLDAVVIEAMLALKQQGKIRCIGVSTHRGQTEVVRAAAESEVYQVVLTSYNFKMADVDALEGAMAFAAGKGLGVIVMKTQAGGFWDDGRRQPIPMRPALRWALRRDFVHTAIPGFTTFDQMEDDLAVMTEPSYGPADEAALVPPERVAGLFCRQCGMCVAGCPADLDLPTLMRGYMYARGYRNLGAARDAVSVLGADELPCLGCRSCSVRCPEGFDVRARAIEVARLRDLPDGFLA